MEYFRIIKPQPHLAPFVKHYWALSTGSGGTVAERTVPTGSVSLIFHRGRPMNSSLLGARQPAAFLSGISSTYSDLLTTERVDMLAVVFHPFGAGAFFRVPLDEYRNTDVALTDTDEPWLRELEGRVRAAANDDVAVGVIEKAFTARLAVGGGYNYGRMLAAVKAASADPYASAGALADSACLSGRQFSRVFSGYVGTTPKEFLRVVRFQRTLHILQNDGRASLVQVAADVGYYDQPHMIREFKSLSGYTPVEYMAACAPYSDYFSE